MALTEVEETFELQRLKIKELQNQKQELQLERDRNRARIVELEKERLWFKMLAEKLSVALEGALAL